MGLDVCRDCNIWCMNPENGSKFQMNLCFVLPDVQLMLVHFLHKYRGVISVDLRSPHHQKKVFKLGPAIKNRNVGLGELACLSPIMTLMHFGKCKLLDSL